MKKTLAILCVAVVVFFSVALPVSADSGEHLTLKKVEIYNATIDDWVNMTDYASWTVRTGGGMNLIVDHPDTDDFSYHGIKATWQPAGYIRLQQGQYFKINMSFTDSYSSASWLPDRFDTGEFYFVIQTSDGGVYSLYPYSYYNEYDENGMLYWDISFASHITGDEITIKSIGFRSNWPSYNNGLDPYSISVFTSITTELTPEMERHQELITKIDSSTQAIIDNQDKNTNSVLNKLKEWFASLFVNDDENTQAIVDAVESQTNEDFGYSDPAGKGDADADIADLAAQISALSDDISKSVDDFKVSINGLKAHMQSGKKFIWGWLDYVPAWFTAIITGFAGLLIARKIVK